MGNIVFRDLMKKLLRIDIGGVYDCSALGSSFEKGGFIVKKVENDPLALDLVIKKPLEGKIVYSSSIRTALRKIGYENIEYTLTIRQLTSKTMIIRMDFWKQVRPGYTIELARKAIQELIKENTKNFP